MRGRHLATNIIKSLRIRTITQEGAFDYLEDEADPVKLFTSANKHSIQCLKQTALTNNLPSLSSNSVHDKVVSAFTIINTQMNDLKETPLQLNHYTQYINPQILTYSQETLFNQEHCPSFPLLKSVVKRYSRIKVKYLDLQKKEVQQQIDGLKALLFQHQMDHLNGITLLAWQRNMGKLFLDQKEQRHFPKTNQVLIDYRARMLRLLKQYPEYRDPLITDPPHISFYQDFIRRFLRHFQRQHSLYKARKALE